MFICQNHVITISVACVQHFPRAWDENFLFPLISSCLYNTQNEKNKKRKTTKHEVSWRCVKTLKLKKWKQYEHDDKRKERFSCFLVLFVLWCCVVLCWCWVFGACENVSLNAHVKWVCIGTMYDTTLCTFRLPLFFQFISPPLHDPWRVVEFYDNLPRRMSNCRGKLQSNRPQVWSLLGIKIAIVI